jgi:hypothetical protein
MAALFVIFCLSLSGCHSYNPALYPSYDVLQPGTDVKINPLGFTIIDASTGAVTIKWEPAAESISKDNLALVNQAFMLWVYELKEEVKKLREELKRK